MLPGSHTTLESAGAKVLEGSCHCRMQGDVMSLAGKHSRLALRLIWHGNLGQDPAFAAPASIVRCFSTTSARLCLRPWLCSRDPLWPRDRPGQARSAAERGAEKWKLGSGARPWGSEQASPRRRGSAREMSGARSPGRAGGHTTGGPRENALPPATSPKETASQVQGRSTKEPRRNTMPRAVGRSREGHTTIGHDLGQAAM